MRVIAKFFYQMLFESLSSLTNVFPDNEIGNRIRGKVIGLFFKKKGANLQISKRTHILYPRKISVGNDIFIGYGAWINAQGGMILEDEVMVGPLTCIVTGNHTAQGQPLSYRFGDHKKELVKIGHGCWIGSHSVVLPGSNLPAGCLIAAGAVVTKKHNLLENHIGGGIPLSSIRSGGNN
ncbi:acyltransferase [Exiguobacterium aestuarii]|uniref:Acyltransferase n=1 Tax=Exiguobacterium aestuarii TaxID=273527 RepID=A0ABW2PHA8_9BACL|nr:MULTISPECIES: acyltransferase [Exiguobacterium]MCT4785123.1 acyltransferase [Exiguobacterium aestuarii]